MVTLTSFIRKFFWRLSCHNVLACVLVFAAGIFFPAVKANGNASEGETFRLMSYNIRWGMGMDGEMDLERTAEVIRSEKADFVALQEVDRGVERSGERDVVGELAELTELKYFAFGKNIDHQGGDYGNAFLSRYPILKTKNTHLPQLGPGERRGVLQVVLDVDGRELVVLNTHFDHRSDDGERMASVEAVKEDVLPEYEGLPMLFAGDFNDVPGSRMHERMKERFTDIWEEVGEGEGLTSSSANPVRRIDYIFIKDTENVFPLKAWVPQSLASDHLPLGLEFRLSDN
ncbi:MAG: endonuclease/exonuclease/phosphatase family protein [Opitutales bacterium]